MAIRFGVFALSLMLVCGPAMASDRTVTVMGEGQVAAVPDVADVSVSSVSQAPTASAAMQATSKKSQAILAAAKAAGIAAKDMQTGNLSLHPVYARRQPGNNEMPPIVGYKASLQTGLTVRDIKTVGHVLDGLVRAGADNLGGLRFSVAKPAALQDRARALAVADAKRIAALLATEAGARLGRVQTIEETSGARPPIGVMRAARAMESAVPVTAGEISVTTRVRVVFALTD